MCGLRTANLLIGAALNSCFEFMKFVEALAEFLIRTASSDWRERALENLPVTSTLNWV